MTIAEQTKLRIRQTDLRTLEERCPAFAYAASVERRDGPAYSGAYRGSAIHDFFRLYVDLLYETGRQTDWDAVPAVLAQVFVDYPSLSFEQREDVRTQARTIAETFIMRPTLYYGSEESFEARIPLLGGGEATVTGRLDYLEIEGEIARVIDCKSNHAILPDSKVKDDYQLRVYAMLVLENLPHVEVVEGRLLMSRYGITLPQKGEATWTREDAAALKEHLSYRLAAHFAGELKGEHIPGTWCAYCPLKRLNECTLYRSYYGTTPPPPLSEEQARKLARRIVALEERRESYITLLKQYVNENGPLPIGSAEYSETFGFHKRESEEIPASAMLAILAESRSWLGEQPVDELLSVKKTTKAFKQLRYHVDLKDAFEDAATTKTSTVFGHKANGGGDD